MALSEIRVIIIIILLFNYCRGNCGRVDEEKDFEVVVCVGLLVLVVVVVSLNIEKTIRIIKMTYFILFYSLYTIQLKFYCEICIRHM